jgi:DNA polymerase-1
MVTPDKDFGAISLREHFFMHKPACMGNGIEIWGIPEVLGEILKPKDQSRY